MAEKIIKLENISLVDFLGVKNKNINELAAAFPKSKVISRGNEILLNGEQPEIFKIMEILDSLIQHYHKFGSVKEEHVKNALQHNEPGKKEPDNSQVLVYGPGGKVIKARTKTQEKLIEAVYKNDLVFALGPAGTGKTYISVALAVEALKKKVIKKIIITRPAVEAGENLGFLPGDLKDKIDPYLRPVYDALQDMIPTEKLRYMQENGIIEIAPLAYMRGRTLHKAFILLDEAQNTSTMQIKMFLTRMGEHSKVIVSGDASQVDLKPGQKSGLKDAYQKLKSVQGIGFVKFSAEDVVRHKLVKDILHAYESDKSSDD